jgi:hypothetical protein
MIAVRGNYTVGVEPIIKKGRKREEERREKREKGERRKEERKEEMHYNCSMHSTVQRILSRNLLDRDNRRAIGRQTGKRSTWWLSSMALEGANFLMRAAGYETATELATI